MPKLIWGDNVRKDMSVCGLTEALDRAEWRIRIHVVNPSESLIVVFEYVNGSGIQLIFIEMTFLKDDPKCN